MAYKTKPKIKNVKVGMVFKSSIDKFGNPNFAKVTKRPKFEHKGDRPDIFYAKFVKPTNFSQKRLSDDREFAVWDYEYKKSYWKRIK